MKIFNFQFSINLKIDKLVNVKLKFKYLKFISNFKFSLSNLPVLLFFLGFLFHLQPYLLLVFPLMH